MKERVEEIKRIYPMIKGKIEKRMEEFRRIGKEGSEKDLFAELVFCLLTPQSKARICWRAVEEMLKENVLFNGSKKEIVERLQGVRFKYNKAGYIILAREKFMEGDTKVKKIIENSNPFVAREWFVKNVKGMGYKEASHFLRNVGKGDDLAILDRHILKNLLLMKVIDEIPSSISRKRYYEMEEKMRKFARRIGIPMCHLDLVLWYKETGEVFK